MTSIIQERFRQLKVCVLVPTYNNAGTLGNVLNDILHYTDQVIVVNDGSTDRTGEVLKTFSQIRPISYTRNRGKGWALRRGFRKALEQGFDYASASILTGSTLPKTFEISDQSGANAELFDHRCTKHGQAGIPGKSSLEINFRISGTAWKRVIKCRTRNAGIGSIHSGHCKK